MVAAIKNMCKSPDCDIKILFLLLKKKFKDFDWPGVLIFSITKVLFSVFITPLVRSMWEVQVQMFISNLIPSIIPGTSP